MKPIRLCLLLAGLAAPVLARGQNDGDTKVVSHVYNGYARVRLPDGSFKPESYTFAAGGFFSEDPIAGDSAETMGFDAVARTVADALQGQHFVPSQDPPATEQLIMLWYGHTRQTVNKPTNYELTERMNARLLGFQDEKSRMDSLYFTSVARDFYEEFRSERYFVVLKAYDFQVAQKEKRLKLLWESRFSIRRQAVDFTERLPRMARFAARTFGQETNGIFNPNSIKGTVKLDEVKVLGPAESR